MAGSTRYFMGIEPRELWREPGSGDSGLGKRRRFCRGSSEAVLDSPELFRYHFASSQSGGVHCVAVLELRNPPGSLRLFEWGAFRASGSLSNRESLESQRSQFSWREEVRANHDGAEEPLCEEH